MLEFAALLMTRRTLVWLVLIGATLASSSLGVGNGFDADGSHRITSVVIVLVAFLKVRLVGMHFMDLKDAPAVLRGLFDGYCFVLCALMLALFLKL